MHDLGIRQTLSYRISPSLQHHPIEKYSELRPSGAPVLILVCSDAGWFRLQLQQRVRGVGGRSRLDLIQRWTYALEEGRG